MATCKHGATEPHGEIGKNWCAGPPRSWYFEAFRGQLEEQMNLDTEMFVRFAIPGDTTARMSSYAIPTTTDVDEAVRDGVGLWQIHSPTSAEMVRAYERPTAERVAALRERYTPPWTAVLGWFSDTPIYDALVAERGDPFRH